MVSMMAHQEVHCLELHLRVSILYPSGGSLDDSNYGPPCGALLGASIYEAGCGADSWGLFEACLRLYPEDL